MKEARFGKEHVIWKLRNVLRGHAMIITEADYMSAEERKEQMQTIEDLVHFLDNYDEDMAFLKQMKKKKTREEMDMIEKEDMGYGGR